MKPARKKPKSALDSDSEEDIGEVKICIIWLKYWRYFGVVCGGGGGGGEGGVQRVDLYDTTSTPTPVQTDYINWVEGLSSIGRIWGHAPCENLEFCNPCVHFWKFLVGIFKYMYAKYHT